MLNQQLIFLQYIFIIYSLQVCVKGYGSHNHMYQMISHLFWHIFVFGGWIFISHWVILDDLSVKSISYEKNGSTCKFSIIFTLIYMLIYVGIVRDESFQIRNKTKTSLSAPLFNAYRDVTNWWLLRKSFCLTIIYTHCVYFIYTTM